jgi:murein DD-endopeptidase MepM/ murein hydrolase activator NlpD
MPRRFLPCLMSIAIAIAPPATAIADVRVNFHPAAALWSYPLDEVRGLHGVLLQNAALVNRGDAPVTIEGVDIEVLDADAVVATWRLDASKLDALAASGGAMAEAGMLQALEFQFSPDTLLGADATVSGARTLAAGAALLLPQRFVSFQGQADSLRVRATLAGVDAPVSGTVSIRAGSAPGTFRFPLRGRWYVGAAASSHGHHRWVVPQEFALDLIRIDAGGATYRGKGTRMKDYFAYGEPVLASASGIVVKAVDGLPDNVAMLRRADESLGDYQRRLREAQGELLAAGLDAVSGNVVVIRHGHGVHSVYAHLRPGSLKVAVGAQVLAGQPIGELGGSGNSTEPHLHFHLCDGPEPLECAGMPVAFSDIELPYSDAPRNLQSGDMVVTTR